MEKNKLPSLRLRNNYYGVPSVEKSYHKYFLIKQWFTFVSIIIFLSKTMVDNMFSCNFSLKHDVIIAICFPVFLSGLRQGLQDKDEACSNCDKQK